MDLRQVFASNLRRLRYERGLSQEALAYEAGVNQRVVLIEFDSVEKAIAGYESEAYKRALKLLEGAAERDVRIVEGVS